jgi:hypothetical protein
MALLPTTNKYLPNQFRQALRDDMAGLPVVQQARAIEIIRSSFIWPDLVK